MQAYSSTYFFRRIVTCLCALTLLLCVSEASVHVHGEHVRPEAEIAPPVAECPVCAFVQSLRGSIVPSLELPSIFPQGLTSSIVVVVLSIIASVEPLRSLARAPPV